MRCSLTWSRRGLVGDLKKLTHPAFPRQISLFTVR
jgi:hypothetical protein